MAKNEAPKLGTNSAWWLANARKEKGGDEYDGGVFEGRRSACQEQYAGPKEKLRPIFDELLTLGKSLGSDVKACPCKTMFAALYRNHVFAANQANRQKSRIDLGLRIGRTFKGKWRSGIFSRVAGERRSNHTPPLKLRLRNKSVAKQRVVEDGLRSGRLDFSKEFRARASSPVDNRPRRLFGKRRNVGSPKARKADICA